MMQDVHMIGILPSCRTRDSLMVRVSKQLSSRCLDKLDRQLIRQYSCILHNISSSNMARCKVSDFDSQHVISYGNSVSLIPASTHSISISSNPASTRKVRLSALLRCLCHASATSSCYCQTTVPHRSVVCMWGLSDCQLLAHSCGLSRPCCTAFFLIFFHVMVPLLASVSGWLFARHDQQLQFLMNCSQELKHGVTGTCHLLLL